MQKPNFWLSLEFVFWELTASFLKIAVLLTTKPAKSYLFFTEALGESWQTYSFCHHKQYQQRLKIGTVGFVLTALTLSLAINLIVAPLIPQLKQAFAATYTLTQTAWDASASPGTYVTHATPPPTVTAYEAKDANLDTATTAGQFSLSTNSQSITDTTDADFSAGATNQTSVSSDSVILEAQSAAWTSQFLGDSVGQDPLSNVSFAGIGTSTFFMSYLTKNINTGFANLVFVSSTDGGGTWTAVTSIDLFDNSIALSPTSLQMIDSNTFFILAYEPQDRDLKLIKSVNGGSSWTLTSVIDNPFDIQGYGYSFYALDANNLFVSYYDNSPDDLKFAKSVNGGSSWTKSTIDSTGDVGMHNSITAVDANTVFISYYDLTNSALKFAKSVNGGTDWTLSTIESTDITGQYSSIKALDANNIFISYYKSTGYDLRFAKSTDGGSSWDTQLVDGTGNCQGTFLEVVDANNLFIVHYNDSGDDLEFSKSTDGGSSWTVTQIETTGDIGRYPVIYAADANNLFVSYFDYTSYNIKFASSANGGGNWSYDFVDYKEYVGNNNPNTRRIAAVDASNIFIVYAETGQADLKLVKTADGGLNWSYQIIDTNPSDYASIAAVDANTIFISYWDTTNYDLKFAKTTDGGSNWSISTIDSAGTVGNYTSVDATDANTLFISYWDSTNYDLKFAKTTDGGSNWSISTIDSAGTVGQFTSLAAIDANTTFISYYDSTNGDLKFTKTTDGGSNWSISTIDSAGTVGLYTSLDAIDTNTIFISYYDSTNGDLKFTKSTDAGANWSTSTIDSAGTVGEDPSLAAVDANTVFISYYASSNLKFAETTNGGSNWSTSTLDSADSAGEVGRRTSIAAVDSGTIFISHVKWMLQNLRLTKYATTYLTPGTFTSDIKNTTVNESFGAITWSDDAVQTITMRVRSCDDAVCIGETAIASCDAVSKNADISSNNCITDGDQYIQYQATLSTADVSQTPTLQDVTINYNQYPPSQTLTSSWYNSTDDTQVLGTIGWQEPTDLPAGTDVRATLQTAPDNGSSAPNTGSATGFLGPDGTTGTYWNSANAAAGGCVKTESGAPGISNVSCSIIPAAFTDGSNDQWFNYKITLTSSGSNTADVYQTAVQYVVNATPAVASVLDEDGSSALNQNSNGTVSLTYTLADDDNSTEEVYFFYDIGITLNDEGGSLAIDDATNIIVSDSSNFPSSGTVLIDNEIITYTGNSSNTLGGTITRAEWPGTASWTTKAAAHTNGAIVYLLSASASETGEKTGITSSPTSFSSTLTAKIDIPNVYTASAKVRVIANDGNAANQVSVGSAGVSGAFTLDTADPASPSITIDAGAVDTKSNTVNLTISVSDNTMSAGSLGSMMLSNNADFSADANNADSGGWITYNTSKSGWNIGTGDGTKTVYVKFKDLYSNTSASANDTIVLDQTSPGVPQSPIVRDLSNFDALEYQLFISWQTIANPARDDWTQYNLWRSTDGVDYGTVYQQITDRTLNYYFDTGLSTSLTYYYKINSEDDLGNISDYSAVVSDQPDGQGGTDRTAPTISSVSVGSLTTQSAVISWITNELANSAVAYGSSVGVFNASSTVATMVTAHEVVLTSLTPATTYYFQVQSSDPAGNTATNDNGGSYYTFTTNQGPAISNTTVTSVDNNSATITWVTNIEANSYVVYSTNADLSLSAQFGSTGLTTNHSIAISSLSQGTKYYFYVKSTDGSSNLAQDTNSGNYYTLTTTTDTIGPVISSIASSSITHNFANITWVTDEAATTQVEYGTASQESGHYDSTTVIDSNLNINHLSILSDLIQNTVYYYRVKSIDGSGNTTTSNEGSFTTALYAVPVVDSLDATGPVISATAAASITHNSASITWTTDEAATSQVEYGTTSGESGSYASTTTIDSNFSTAHSVALSNLTQNTTYYYRVKSKDVNGNETVSSEGSFKTALYEVPQADINDATGPVISNIATSALRDTSVNITWTTDEAATSQMEYGTSTGSYTSQTTISASFTASHNVPLSSLSANTTYYYRVKSKDVNNNETISAENSFTTQSALYEETQAREQFQSGGGGGIIVNKDTNPPVISEIKVSGITVDSALISWNTNELANGLVQYGFSVNYEFLQGQAITLNKTHSAALKQLSTDTIYHFRVISQDQDGNAAVSENRTFATLKAPTVLSPEEKVLKETEDIEELAQEETSEEEIKQTTLQTAVQKLVDIVKIYSNQISLNLTEPILFSQYEELAKLMPPPLLKGEPVVKTTATTATVIWQTDKEANSLVALSPEDQYDSKKEEPYQQIIGNPKGKTKNHLVQIYDLEPDTVYHYQVRSQSVFGPEAKSNDFTFSTLSEGLEITNYIIQNVSPQTAVFKWVTNIEADSQLTYMPYRENILSVEEAQTKTDPVLITIHETVLNNLEGGVVYNIELSSTDAQNNTAKQNINTFSTSQDDLPPIIYQVRTESAFTLGKNPKIQTIISWLTNEPAKGRIYYQKGIEANKKNELLEKTNLDKDYNKNHVAVITKFDPGSIYMFKVESTDSSGNTSVSKTYTILTPRQGESVFQVLTNTIDEAFGWLWGNKAIR